MVPEGVVQQRVHVEQALKQHVGETHEAVAERHRQVVALERRAELARRPFERRAHPAADGAQQRIFHRGGARTAARRQRHG